MRFLVAGAVTLIMSAGCIQREPAPSDAELIARLKANPAAFNDAVQNMTTEPIIARIETVASPPQTVEPREARLRLFMADQGVESIETRPDGRLVSFTMFTGGLGVSGQMKRLTYSEVTPEGEVVADTDAEIAQGDKRWRVAVRSIGNSWYIENLCC